VKGADLAVEAAAKVAVVVRRAVAADKVAAGARRAAAVVVEVDPEDLVEVVADRVAGARVAAVEVREATGNRQRNSHDERLTLSESGALFLPGVRSGILGTGLTSDLRRHMPLVVTAVTWHPGGGTRRSNELKAWTRRETQAATC
jgi:hypothetical protein